MNVQKRWPRLVIGIALGFMLGSATLVLANGGVVREKGSTIDRVKTAAGGGGEAGPSVTAGSLDIPGARHSLILNQTSLVLARFSAATMCSGGPGRCEIRIKVLDNKNGDAFITEMNGLGHVDSTFGGDGHEGHYTEQSITLPPGDYDFQVKMQTTNCCDSTDPITFHIPGWRFTVERIV
jgi:hypothetical protein